MLSNSARALKPQGRIGVVDFAGGHGPGPALEERVSPDIVVKDAKQAGLQADPPGAVPAVSAFLIFREVTRRAHLLIFELVKS